MEHLELKGVEKGSITNEYKVKSLNQRWFSTEESKPEKSHKRDETKSEGGVYIERYSLIQLNCNLGRTEPLEYYQALPLFTKCYKIWYVAVEDKVKWTNVLKPNNIHILGTHGFSI